MKFIVKSIFVLLVLTLLTSANAHKFYVGIHQIHFTPEMKMLQITSRIFIDDLNDALQQKHKSKFYIGEKAETATQIDQMQQYLTDRFQIKINGKPRPIQFLSKETDNNVVICYFAVRDVPKVSSLTISNRILFDLVTEQQNIMQTTVNGQKNSLLLTNDNPTGEINY